MIIKKVNLDLSSSTEPMVLNVQKDEHNSRQLDIELFNNGIRYPIDSNQFVEMQFDKPDGTTIIESSEGDFINVHDSIISIIFSNKMTYKDGIARAKISIYDDTSILFTTLFKIQIEGGLIDTTEVIGSNEYNMLNELIAKAAKDCEDIIGKAVVIGVKGDTETQYRQGNVNISKENIGLAKVENKSVQEILSEITDTLIINKLGFTPISTVVFDKKFIISSDEPIDQEDGWIWEQPYVIN